MFQIDLKSRKSIYAQIVDNMKELIITGILQENEKLPSVRELAASLTVNPNPIQKAYRELERQGYLYTASGLGSFVAPSERRQIDQEEMRETGELLKKNIRELSYLGVSAEAIQQLVDEALKRGREKGSR